MDLIPNFNTQNATGCLRKYDKKIHLVIKIPIAEISHEINEIAKKMRLTKAFNLQ